MGGAAVAGPGMLKTAAAQTLSVGLIPRTENFGAVMKPFSRKTLRDFWMLVFEHRQATWSSYWLGLIPYRAQHSTSAA